MLTPRRRPLPRVLAVATLAVVIAAGIELALPSAFGGAPFRLLFAAVAFAGWYGGAPAGLLAIVLSVIVGQRWLSPAHTWFPTSAADQSSLAAFVGLMTFIVLLLEQLHAVARRLLRSELTLAGEHERLRRALDGLRNEQENLARANEQLQVQGEELEVTAEELKAQSDDLQSVERELRRQLGYIAAVTDSMLEGLYAIDPQGRCTFVNPSAERQLGWSRGELLSRSMHETIHYQRVDGGAYPVEQCPSTRVLRTGRALVVENEVFTTRDGMRIPVTYSAAPLVTDGQVSGVVVAFSDVTERRKAEDERERLLGAERVARTIAENERARTTKILETISEGFFAIDRELRYVAVNHRYAAMTGRQVKGLVGSRLLDVFPDSEDRTVVHEIRRVLAHGGEAHHVERDAAGEQWFETHLYATDDGVAGFVRDVSERRAAELAVRDREERLRLAVEAGAMGTWDWDAVTETLRWSARLQDMFGLAPDAFDGTFDGFIRAVHPDDRERVTAEIARSREAGDTYVTKHRVIHADGSVHWLEGHGRVIRDAAGRATRMVGVTLDVTDRERGREELQAAVLRATHDLQETVEELDAFSYSVAHDLRAPIRAMHGFAEAILDDDGSSAPAQNFARSIAGSAEQMDLLIQDLLAYSRMARSDIEPQPVELKLVLDEALTAMRQVLERARVTVEVTEELPRVLGHRATLFQVITNLVSNGVKFVAPGVTPALVVRGEPRPDAVRLWFEDNGIGIAPRYHDRIFGVFERLHRTAQYPGTGVGLAIVRRGMERMGGRYGVESEPERGSRFWIELPRADRGAAPAHDGVPAAQPEARAARSRG